MNSFHLARLSLQRNPFSTTVCVLAIALSVACCGLLLRLHLLSEARFNTISTEYNAVVGAKAGGTEILLGSLNAEGEYPGFLPMKLFESLKSQQTIVHGDGVSTTPSYIRIITPFVYFGKVQDFRVAGTDETFFSSPYRRMEFQEGAWQNDKGRVVLGAAVAKSLGLQKDDKIKIHAWTSDHDSAASDFELTVAGVLRPTGKQWDRLLFSNLEQAKEVLSSPGSRVREASIWGADVLQYFLIQVNATGFKGLEDLINKRTVGQVIQTENSIAKLKELAGAGQNIGIIISFFIMTLGVLLVSSMIVTRFDAMSSQIAVLRAIGYSKNEISKWLFWEGLLLGVFGIFIGGLLDFIFFPVVRGLLGNSLPPAELVSGSLAQSAPIWLLAIFAIVFSVIVPILRTFKKDVHQLLRGL